MGSTSFLKHWRNLGHSLAYGVIILLTILSQTLNPDGTTATPSDSTMSMTWTPTPVTSVETITGQVKTVTITPTAPPTTADNNSLTQTGSGGLSTGGAVGLTIGLVALVAVLGAVILFLFKRRRQMEGDQYNDDPIRTDSSSGPLPKRTMSENSRFMLGTDGRQVVEEWEQEPEMSAGSRRSRLMPVDPRLDPFAPVYQRGDGNKSGESITTIRDDHDYSRRVHQERPILRATNPDPIYDD
jgi:cell wall integrity and stress response component